MLLLDQLFQRITIPDTQVDESLPHMAIVEVSGLPGQVHEPASIGPEELQQVADESVANGLDHVLLVHQEQLGDLLDGGPVPVGVLPPLQHLTPLQQLLEGTLVRLTRYLLLEVIQSQVSLRNRQEVLLL